MRFCATATAIMTSAAALAGPFDIEGLKPDAALVLTPGTDTAGTNPAHPAMVLRENGVRAVLVGEQVRRLGRVGTTRRITMPSDATACMRVRVFAAGVSKDIDVLRDDQGRFLISAGSTTQSHAMVLNDEAFTLAMIPAMGFAGSLASHADDPRPSGTTRLVGPALTPSFVTLDGPTLKARFTHGGATLDATTRKICDEAVFVRLPASMNPKIASGLVVYVHPGPQSGIPEAMHAALDELGFIAVAPDNVPNDRHRVDRMQLTLDAVATGCDRYVIDPERIYVTGVSGGGKIASHTWACAPDIVSGVVAMVGVGSYENMRRSDGKYWRGDFEKPLGPQLKHMKAGRLAAITGSEDGNQDYIQRALAIMKGDGLTVRLDDFEGMEHEMATPERFADALRWVDEPARTKRDQAVARAAELMTGLRVAKATDVESIAAQRAALAQVMQLAPFSEPSWEAAELWSRVGAD